MSESYKYKNESQLLPDGDYEARIEKIEVKTLPTSGKDKLSIMYRIRDDIDDQVYGNKCVFEDIWREKESPEHFNRKRLNQLLGTQEIEDGRVFDTINDIIDFLTENNCLIIHVGVVFNEYFGGDVNKVCYYKSSKHKPQKLVKDIEKVKVEANDDDLPF